MKVIFSIAVLFVLVVSCKSKARSEAENIKSVIESSTAGSENVKGTGMHLKATIDGKPWEAEYMMPDKDVSSSYRRVHGEAGDISIGFQLWKPTTGSKLTLTDDHVIDFITDKGFYAGRKGEVTVTKADADWMEGTFWFTATSQSSPGTYEVKEGSFRVPVAK